MSQYGLLDPMPLDQKDENFLKCDKCGLIFGDVNDENDFANIDLTGCCEDCFNEQYD